MFFRNQGAACVAPKTEKNEACSAIPEKPSRIVGLYPAELQEKDPKFARRYLK